MRQHSLIFPSIPVVGFSSEQLDQLSQQTRIPKAVLLREAVDDLLVKHKVLRTADLRRPVARP